MRILLVRPKPHKETIGLQSVMICQPLELMELSAVLRANGHTVCIVDMILEKKNLSFFLGEFAPDLVGITGYISHIGVMKQYAREVKAVNSNIVTAVGGVHATVCPEDFEDIAIDYICKTAEAFYELTGCPDRTKRLPDRTLPPHYTNRYYYLFAQNCALIKMSFGCPYDCNFCFCKEIAPYSARSIDDCIRELLEIPQKEVYIVDDDFLFNPARLLEFYEKLKTHHIDKHFLVYGRADFIAANEAILAKLAEVGLTGVIVGIESASQEELDKFGKKSKLSDNEAAVKILQKYRIECYGTVILGVDWDKKDFARLHQYIKKLKLVFVNLQPFTPMPGTGYFAEYAQDLIIPYTEYEKWDMAHLVIRPTKISVRNYYWQILKLYYKITVPPQNVLYMFRRYGIKTTLKLSLGAVKISLQYLEKIIRG